MKLPTKIVHIRIPKELIEKLDTYAAKLYVSRSEVIREAIVDRLRANVGSTLPADGNVQLALMTDEQLLDLKDMIQGEWRRRFNKKHPIF